MPVSRPHVTPDTSGIEAMTEFFPGVTPQALIPGDPGELLSLVGSLCTLADRFDAAGRELQRIEPGAWRGDAAEAAADARRRDALGASRRLSLQAIA